MSEAINELVKHLITFFKPIDCDSMTSVIDSMPIITCAGKCKIGKVAPEIATKGYCSTKNMYYFGLKLHTLAFRREGVIPFPEMIILSLAEENDLTVLKREAANYLINRDILADKIYSDLLLGKRTARTRANYADSRQRQKGRRFYYYSKTESGQRTIFNCGIKGKITDKIFFQLAE